MEKDRFNASDDKQLISFVEKNPMFYNKADPEYANSHLKIKMWSNIATKLSESAGGSSDHKQFTWKDCRQRWTTLRDRYSKKHSRREKPTGSGLKVSFSAFSFNNQMDFLKPYINRKAESKRKNMPNDISNTNNTIQQVNIDSGDDDVEVLKEQDNFHESMLDPETGDIIKDTTANEVQTRDNAPPKKNKLTKDITANEVQTRDSPPPKKKKSPKNDENETFSLIKSVKKLTNVMMSKNQSEEEDNELRSFCNTLYHKLYDVPKKHRLEYQLAILQTIKNQNDKLNVNLH